MEDGACGKEEDEWMTRRHRAAPLQVQRDSSKCILYRECVALG
jgi:hypothetical protein